MLDDDLKKLDVKLSELGAELFPKCTCREVGEEFSKGEDESKYRWRYCPFCGSKVVWSFREKAEGPAKHQRM